jgi:hypothetical protein
MWLQQVKSACHKWRVTQNIHLALPPTCHIELILDHIKLWYADGQVTKLTELPFYLIVDQIFGELSRQSNMITPITPEARDIQVDLLLPLMDGEKVEQHEAKLQMQSFVSKAQTSTSNLENKSFEKEDNTSSELTEEDIDILLNLILELNFEHPRIQKKITPKILQHMVELSPTWTRDTNRKRYEFSSLGVEFEAAIEQAYQEISQAYKDAMAKYTSSSKKTKTIQFDIPKPDVTSQEEQEVIDDSPDVIPTTIEEEEPSTPPSPSKIPSVSLSTSPPKSPSTS